MFLDVSLLSPSDVLFKGKASSVMVPGEQGVFEVAIFHRRIISRLISGIILIDDKEFRMRRGIIKVDRNKVTILIEEA